MAKEINRKAAASRRTSAKPNVASARRSAQPTGRTALGYSGGLGAAASRGVRQSTPGNTNVGATNPTYTSAAPIGAVTPIAAPPVVTDPFLTPTDLANQAIDVAGVTDYLNNVDLQTSNARTAADQARGDINTAQGRNVEANDWNTASRGLAQSSIRDTNRANIMSDADRARTANEGNLANATTYGAAAHKNAEENVLPAIASKYNELAKSNAQDVTDQTAGGATPPAGGTGNVPTSASGAPIKGAGPTVQESAPLAVAPNAASAAGYKPVVKNGNFYHVYPDGRWILIRKAA